ncbi:hypothetical protein ACFL5V_08310 [Fibrobacterota bacterium]
MFNKSSDKSFLAKGSRYMVLDNITKVVDPLLVFVCAGLYAGGDWGTFKYYESLMLLLMRFSSLGLDKGVIWFHSQISDRKEFLKQFARCVNLTLLIWIVLGAGVIMARLEIISWPWTNLKAPISISSAYLGIFLLTVPLQVLTLLFLQALVGKKVLFPTAMVKNIILPLMTYGTALLLFFTPLKAEALGMSLLLGCFAGLLVSAGIFFHYYRPSIKDWSFHPLPGMRLLKFSLPLASTEFFMSFAVRVDLLLLAQYAGVKTLEVYSIVVIVANSLRSIRQSFENILLAIFSKSDNHRVNREQKEVYNYVCWLIMSIQTPILILFIMLGSELLGLISSGYVIGHWALVIVTIFIFINTPGAFSGTLMMGLGKTYIIPVSQVMFFISSVSLNYLLIPQFGILGAAIASGFSVFLGGQICFIACNFFSEGFLLSRHLIMRLGAGLVVFAPSLVFFFHAGGGIIVRAVMFIVPLVIYAAYSWRNWRHFNEQIK